MIHISYIAVCFVLERLEKQQLGELIQHGLPREIILKEGPKPVCCVCFACSAICKIDVKHKTLCSILPSLASLFFLNDHKPKTFPPMVILAVNGVLCTENVCLLQWSTNLTATVVEHVNTHMCVSPADIYGEDLSEELRANCIMQ